MKKERKKEKGKKKRRSKDTIFFLSMFLTSILISLVLFGCGQEIYAGSSEPVTPVDTTTDIPNDTVLPEEPVQDTTDTNLGGGGGGGSGSITPPAPECLTSLECNEGFECIEQHCVTLPPVPECLTDLECNEGFECVEQRCVALPECRPAEELKPEIQCEDPNNMCSENVCVPKPCELSEECIEPGFCLPDRSFNGEGEIPTICREKSCPIVGETISLENINVPQECSEENESDALNLLQNIVHPDLSTIIEAWKICEIEEQATVLSQRFTDLDNKRIELDNFLAGCNND